MNVEKKSIHHIQEFDELKDDWEVLENGIDMTAYQSFRWNRLLLQEHFNSALADFFSEVIVYSVKEDDKTTLILPLIVQKIRNKTVWFGRSRGVYILGVGSYSDYLNAIYNEVNIAAFELLFEHLKKDFKGLIFNFTDLIEGTKFESFISEIGITAFDSAVSVAVNITKSAEEYSLSLSKHTRQNLRTAVNRMKKDNVNYECRVVFNKITDLKTLDVLRDLHIMRIIEKNYIDTDIIHKLSSNIRIYLKKRKEIKNNIVYESMKSMDNSVFVIVYLNNEISGYLYGLKEGKNIRIMQNCVKTENRFYSPMFKGTYDFLIDCHTNEEVSKVDFTRGKEPYKYQLGGVETVLRQYKGKLS